MWNDKCIENVDFIVITYAHYDVCDVKPVPGDLYYLFSNVVIKQYWFEDGWPVHPDLLCTTKNVKDEIFGMLTY